MAQIGKHLRGNWVRSLGWDDLLEKEMATYSSSLAWKIPWMEEPGRLQSMGSQSGTRLSDFTFTFTFCGSESKESFCIILLVKKLAWVMSPKVKRDGWAKR